MNEDDRVELSPIERLAEHLCARPFQPSCDDPIREMADWLDYSLNRCCLVVVEEQSLARAPLQGADTVTEAMLEAGSRVLCRAYELDDGWDEKQAEKHAASEMGLNFRREARDCYTAMRTAAPTAQDDTGARLDADWKQLQDDLAEARGEQSPVDGPSE